MIGQLLQYGAAAFVMLHSACSVPAGGDSPQHGPVSPSTTAPVSAAVQYIIENPAAYAGKHVTATGQVVDIWSPQVFTIVGQQFLANDALLVVARAEVPELYRAAGGGGIPHGMVVRVSGLVRTDSLDTIEREFDIEVATAVQSLGRAKGPVLLADRIVVVRTREHTQ